jgi:rSAM/selenodomain-associated transferase 2
MSVSVIIPTLNEACCLSETLSSLLNHKPHEIIVVDGGSQDATCEIVSRTLSPKSEQNPNSEFRNSKQIQELKSQIQNEKAPEVTNIGDLDFRFVSDFGFRISNLRLLHSPPGRARQMNLGASHATGDTLLFLHADCQLEAGALEAAEKCLNSSNILAGCFNMEVRAPGRLYRLIDSCATARVRLSGLIYGDQGLFLKRELFQRLGGFPDLRLMEDVFFSRTLARHGRIAVLPQRIYVSPRRWKRKGLIRQSMRNWLLTSLAAGGVHPDRLSIFYPPIR